MEAAAEAVAEVAAEAASEVAVEVAAETILEATTTLEEEVEVEVEVEADVAAGADAEAEGAVETRTTTLYLICVGSAVSRGRRPLPPCLGLIQEASGDSSSSNGTAHQELHLPSGHPAGARALGACHSVR